MKRWVVVLRALGNINRLKIIDILSRGKKMSVGELAKQLRISLKSTSNHLAILKNLDVLEAEGANGRVFYSTNRGMPNDFMKILRQIIKMSL